MFSASTRRLASLKRESSQFKVSDVMLKSDEMEKIDPQRDHESLTRFKPGQQIQFRGKPFIIQQRTTLASGEAAWCSGRQSNS